MHDAQKGYDRLEIHFLDTSLIIRIEIHFLETYIMSFVFVFYE